MGELFIYIYEINYRFVIVVQGHAHTTPTPTVTGIWHPCITMPITSEQLAWEKW